MARESHNIDDILASVTSYGHSSSHYPPHDTTRTRGYPSHAPKQRHLLQRLTRAWHNERCSPDLLPYPAALLAQVTARVREAIDAMETLTGNPDPRSNLSLIVIQTDLERWKFLVRSFVRQRLAKIDGHLWYYASLAASVGGDGTVATSTAASGAAAAGDGGLFAPAEREYITHHTHLLTQHFQSSFLESLPPALQKMDDRAAAAGGGMVAPPDGDVAVFVRAVVDQVVASSAGATASSTAGSNGGDSGGGGGSGGVYDGSMNGLNSSGIYASSSTATATAKGIPRVVKVPGTDIELSLRMGDVVVVRWSAVRELVLAGVCELL